MNSAMFGQTSHHECMCPHIRAQTSPRLGTFHHDIQRHCRVYQHLPGSVRASLQPDNVLLHQALQAQTASRQAQAELTDWSCTESGGSSSITTAEHKLLYAQVGSVLVICHPWECEQSDAELVGWRKPDWLDMACGRD